MHSSTLSPLGWPAFWGRARRGPVGMQDEDPAVSDTSLAPQLSKILHARRGNHGPARSHRSDPLPVTLPPSGPSKPLSAGANPPPQAQRHTLPLKPKLNGPWPC